MLRISSRLRQHWAVCERHVSWVGPVVQSTDCILHPPWPITDSYANDGEVVMAMWLMGMVAMWHDGDVTDLKAPIGYDDNEVVIGDFICSSLKQMAGQTFFSFLAHSLPSPLSVISPQADQVMHTHHLYLSNLILKSGPKYWELRGLSWSMRGNSGSGTKGLWSLIVELLKIMWGYLLTDN